MSSYEELYFRFFDDPTLIRENTPVGFGYVYLYEWNKDVTKVGKTADLKNRFNQLRRASQHGGVIYVSQACRDYSVVESKLHELFHRHRLVNYSPHCVRELYDLDMESCLALANFVHLYVEGQDDYDPEAERRAIEFIKQHSRRGRPYRIDEMEKMNLQARDRRRLENLRKIREHIND